MFSFLMFCKKKIKLLKLYFSIQAIPIFSAAIFVLFFCLLHLSCTLPPPSHSSFITFPLFSSPAESWSLESHITVLSPLFNNPHCYCCCRSPNLFWQRLDELSEADRKKWTCTSLVKPLYPPPIVVVVTPPNLGWQHMQTCREGKVGGRESFLHGGDSS